MRNGGFGTTSSRETCFIVGRDFGSKCRHDKASVTTRTTLLAVDGSMGGERRESNTSFNMMLFVVALDVDDFDVDFK